MRSDSSPKANAERLAKLEADKAIVKARSVGSAAPPKGPVDLTGRRGDDGDMERRIEKLEQIAEKTGERLAAIEQDVAIIKSNYATKEDVQKVATDLLKAMNDQTWKFVTWMSSICVGIVGATYFIAAHVAR